MSAFEHIRTILLSIPGGGGSISEKFKDERHSSWFKTEDIEKAVEILKTKHMEKNCYAYPNCGSCTDAGCYRHTKLDFRIHSNLMLIGFKSCSLEGNVTSMTTEIIHIYADNVTDLVQIIRKLNFPRYAIENIPEEIMDRLSQALFFCSLSSSSNHNQSQSSLKVIELKGVDITFPTIKLLQNVLIGSTSLEQLHFVECYLPMDDDSDYREDGEYLECLIQGIKASQSLKILRFEDCGISDEGLMVLVSSKNVEKLNISGNRCNVSTLKTLGEILKENDNNNNNSCKIQHLNLSWQADPLDISPLVYGLGQNKSVIELNLQWNELSDNGIQCLVKQMKHNYTLEKLCFKRSNDDDNNAPNCLTQCGLQYLGLGLASSFHGLKYLDLSGNVLGNNALKYLANGLTKNSILESLICRNVFVKEKNILQLFTALPKSKLKLFDFSNGLDKTMTPESMNALLCGSINLKVLYVSFSDDSSSNTNNNNNNNNEEIMSIFSTHLPQMKHLIELHLLNSYSPLNEYCLLQLVKGLENNTSITKLILDEVVVNDDDDDSAGNNMTNLYQKLMYYMRLNSGGRYLLHTSLFPSLWPYVLEKSNHDPDILRYLLTQEVLWA